jgi:nitrogen regulatory protein PII
MDIEVQAVYRQSEEKDIIEALKNAGVNAYVTIEVKGTKLEGFNFGPRIDSEPMKVIKFHRLDYLQAIQILSALDKFNKK